MRSVSVYCLLLTKEHKFNHNASKSHPYNWLLSLTVHPFFTIIKGPFPAIKSLSFAHNRTITNHRKQLTKETIVDFQNQSYSSYQVSEATIDC